MMWKLIQACSPGTSHLERNEDCQDNCLADRFRDRNGQDYLLCLVSDGAGSASRGGQGAETVCEQGYQLIREQFQNQVCDKLVTEEMIREWVTQIRESIFQKAEEQVLKLRDFACTILGVMISHQQTLFFQIGDGAIVVDDGNDFVPVFWPDAGEYINETHFITEEEYLSHLRIKITDKIPQEIGLFTDGLQRLALVYRTRSAHKPFFETLLSWLRKATPETCDYLSDALCNFLNSSMVNERTDDDKTLVLATRRSQ